MKHIKIVTISILFICLSVIIPVSRADVGPKPTTDVEIIGMDEPYYFDLLARYDEDEVIVLDENTIQEQIEHDYYRDDFPDVLNGYRDEDGFASYTLYSDAPHSISQVETHLFHCGYFVPPNVFKIVLVTASGDMIVSDIITKQLFDAYVIFRLTDFLITEAEGQTYNDIMIYFPGEDAVYEDIPVKGIIMQIVISILLTIAIEGVILLAFGYRKITSFLKMLYVNLGTQALLYTAIMLGGLYGGFFGYFGILILGEAIVLVVEVILYALLLREITKGRAMMYAMVANVTSLVIGLISVTYLLQLLS